MLSPVTMPSMRRGYLSNKEFLVDPEFLSALMQAIDMAGSWLPANELIGPLGARESQALAEVRCRPTLGRVRLLHVLAWKSRARLHAQDQRG